MSTNKGLPVLFRFSFLKALKNDATDNLCLLHRVLELHAFFLKTVFSGGFKNKEEKSTYHSAPVNSLINASQQFLKAELGALCDIKFPKLKKKESKITVLSIIT